MVTYVRLCLRQCCQLYDTTQLGCRVIQTILELFDTSRITKFHLHAYVYLPRRSNNPNICHAYRIFVHEQCILVPGIMNLMKHAFRYWKHSRCSIGRFNQSQRPRYSFRDVCGRGHRPGEPRLRHQQPKIYPQGPYSRIVFDRDAGFIRFRRQ